MTVGLLELQGTISRHCSAKATLCFPQSYAAILSYWRQHQVFSVQSATDLGHYSPRLRLEANSVVVMFWPLLVVLGLL